MCGGGGGGGRNVGVGVDVEMSMSDPLRLWIRPCFTRRRRLRRRLRRHHRIVSVGYRGPLSPSGYLR